ncbi:MAG: hypothetical protein K0S54_336 [Alphaproteobacteria bacterium]|jgi:hypothetical protein|nr:hypothetical protein [Alphaproteobacteria bacterium]
MKRIAGAGFVLTLGLMAPALAQDYAKFVADGHVELRFDSFPQSDLKENERLDVNLHGDANLGFYLTRELSLQSTLKVESVRDPRPGRDRYISGTGLFVEQLYVDYDHEDFGLYAGKFNPTFGIAWARLPELLHEEFSEEYETTEMIGLGGSVKFAPSGFGRHEVNAAVFFVDTTFLHASLFASPQANDERANRLSNLRRRDGGPGNTGRLNNFSATLDGGEFEFAPGLFYHLGVRHLSRGRIERKDETAYAMGIGYRFEFSDGSVLTPLVEYVHFDNFEGGIETANMLTVGLNLELDKWAIGVAGSRRHITVASIDGPDVTDWMVGFNVAREIGHGLELGAGYRHERIEGVHSDWIRLYVGYHFSFTR